MVQSPPRDSHLSPQVSPRSERPKTAGQDNQPAPPDEKRCSVHGHQILNKKSRAHTDRAYLRQEYYAAYDPISDMLEKYRTSELFNRHLQAVRERNEAHMQAFRQFQGTLQTAQVRL